MPITALSLAVVGAPYGNKDGSNREFEILLCEPGDPVALLPEPKNRYDEHAISVLSKNGVQMGYINSERAPYVGGLLRAGHALFPIFQERTPWGCVIRIGIDEPPSLPPRNPTPTPAEGRDDVCGFEPDYVPPDEYL
jgi:hypothetical protein